MSLVWALLTETLEGRFDEAFGVTRTETERNEILSQRVQELEQDISEAFWVEDEARAECDYYEPDRAGKRHRPLENSGDPGGTGLIALGKNWDFSIRKFLAS